MVLAHYDDRNVAATSHINIVLEELIKDTGVLHEANTTTVLNLLTFKFGYVIDIIELRLSTYGLKSQFVLSPSFHVHLDSLLRRTVAHEQRGLGRPLVSLDINDDLSIEHELSGPT